MTVKSYKYRFYPTPEQEQMLAQTFGCVRYVFNRALAYRSEQYKATGKGPSYADTDRRLTQWKREPESLWLKDVSCVPLQQTLRHLHTAYANFFAKRAKYPRFKRKGHSQSATYTRRGFKWDAVNGNLTIAKIGRLRVRWSRQFAANPSTVTISKTPSGKYFVSIRIDEENQTMPVATEEVGIDLGIAQLATDSNGKHVANKRTIKQYATQLARAQRTLSRRKKGSNRWNRARIRVAKIQERIANVRLDWTHKTTTQIVKENQLVCVENLKVKNMSKSAKGTVENPGSNVAAKSGLNKAIWDAGWFEFRRQLEYKCAWYGREFVAVNPANTSRTCPCCGHCSKDNRKSQANFECQSCGHTENADVVGAKNILAAGRAVSGRGAEQDLRPVSSGRKRRRRSVKQLEVLHC